MNEEKDFDIRNRFAVEASPSMFKFIIEAVENTALGEKQMEDLDLTQSACDESYVVADKMMLSRNSK